MERFLQAVRREAIRKNASRYVEKPSRERVDDVALTEDGRVSQDRHDSQKGAIEGEVRGTKRRVPPVRRNLLLDALGLFFQAFRVGLAAPARAETLQDSSGPNVAIACLT